jgi:hypothetical protein
MSLLALAPAALFLAAGLWVALLVTVYPALHASRSPEDRLDE